MVTSGQQIKIEAEELGRSTPVLLAPYLSTLLSSVPTCFAARMERQSRELWLRRINALFRRCADVLGTDPNEVLRMADFSNKDCSPERFDALIAELRAVAFLDNEQHTEIRLLPSGKSLRADGVSHLKTEEFAWEAVCITYTDNQIERSRNDISTHSGVPVGETEEQLCSEIRDRWETKRPQLNATVAEFSATRRALIVVINRPSITGRFNSQMFARILRRVHTLLRLDDSCHLVIVTGETDGATGEIDDCVYPSW